MTTATTEMKERKTGGYDFIGEIIENGLENCHKGDYASSEYRITIPPDILVRYFDYLIDCATSEDAKRREIAQFFAWRIEPHLIECRVDEIQLWSKSSNPHLRKLALGLLLRIRSRNDDAKLLDADLLRECLCEGIRSNKVIPIGYHLEAKTCLEKMPLLFEWLIDDNERVRGFANDCLREEIMESERASGCIEFLKKKMCSQNNVVRDCATSLFLTYIRRREDYEAQMCQAELLFEIVPKANNYIPMKSERIAAEMLKRMPGSVLNKHFEYLKEKIQQVESKEEYKLIFRAIIKAMCYGERGDAIDHLEFVDQYAANYEMYCGGFDERLSGLVYELQEHISSVASFGYEEEVQSMLETLRSKADLLCELKFTLQNKRFRYLAKYLCIEADRAKEQLAGIKRRKEEESKKARAVERITQKIIEQII